MTTQVGRILYRESCVILIRDKFHTRGLGCLFGSQPPVMTSCTFATDKPCDDVDTTRSDAGATMVEVLIAIVLMGTVVAAITGAMLTSISASSRAFDIAELETVLINASDSVDRATRNCDYSAEVDAAGISEGWPSGSVTAVAEILVRDPDGSNARFESACVDVKAGDVQTVLISATHPSSGVVQTLKVVKSSVP